MRVRFVGSGDAFGSGGRWQTCISLTAAGQHLLVDCGATSLAALRAQGIDPGTVDAVAVTHLHGDHFGGLPFLVLDAQFGRRARPLRVLGPPGTADRLAAAMEVLFPGSSQVARRFTVEVSEVVPGAPAVEVGAFAVRGWEVRHPSGAPPLALRVSAEGAGFAYTGDTEWTPALTAAAEGADLLVAEAYTFDKRVPYHLDHQTLLAHRADLPADRIVLTHMSAGMLARLADAALPAAYDGMTVDL